MQSQHKVCIGWPELGDLEAADIRSKRSIINLLTEEGYYPDDNRNKSRKAGEIYNFYSKIDKGDVILAQDGQTVLGIGKVREIYHFNVDSDFPHQRDVDWLVLLPQLTNSEGLRTTVCEIKDRTVIDSIERILSTAPSVPLFEPANSSNQMKEPLNQILFGPPGTGKTYTTVNQALAIIGERVTGKPRTELKRLFDDRMKDGQIMFTTFHQSMSYEDFIEGIKPIEPKQEGQNVTYQVIDGIFKQACALAAYNSYKLFSQRQTSLIYSFDDLYEAFIDSVQKQLAQGTPPVYKTLRGQEVEIKEINSNQSIIARAKESISSSSAPLTKENLQKLYDTFKSIEEIKDLTQVKHAVQVTPRITEFYAVFGGLKEFEKEFKPDIVSINEVKETATIDPKEIQKKFNAGVYNEAIRIYGKEAAPVVLVIDEINRGNISQIFGELITLIEDDKRLGMEEALEVTLPYSKVKFGVPPNLYIIGTMNTADRSVQALDAALRRRFSFKEMPPESKLIASEGKLKEANGVLHGIDLPILLETVNRRTEKLLDKDHRIGHSYLMPVSTLDELKAVFQNKIIPLLQEYFFGDYGKIGLVVGKGFFEELEEPDMEVFADFEAKSSSDFAERIIYKMKSVTNMVDNDFIDAINLLLKK
jgi:hypothetical protein